MKNTRQVITFSSDKGGTGKTTNALNCSMTTAIHHPKKKVAFIDNDKNRSATGWLASRGDNRLPNNFSFHYANSIEELKRLLKKLINYDYVFIDTGAGDSQEQRFVWTQSNIIIITIQPSGLDFNSLPENNLRIKALQKIHGSISAYNLLTMCETLIADKDASEIYKLILENQDVFLPVLHTRIYRRRGVKKATDQGFCVEEVAKRNGKSIAEIQLLLQELGVI